MKAILSLKQVYYDFIFIGSRGNSLRLRHIGYGSFHYFSMTPFFHNVNNLPSKIFVYTFTVMNYQNPSIKQITTRFDKN